MTEIQAAPWALKASRLPVAFAQVREDPRLDCELASNLPPNATVVMIASGGETLVEVSRLPNVKRVLAVDLNPAQIALARLKSHLAEKLTPNQICCLLGHAENSAADRLEAMRRSLDELGLPEDIFGAPDEIAALGVDHAGRYERCFAELRRELGSTESFVQDSRLDEALAKVMSLENLIVLFGKDATQNPARTFAEHFAERTRIALRREHSEGNPFLWQMYRGCFSNSLRYDWLKSSKPRHAEIVMNQGLMRDFLESLPSDSVDLVHLSNILDWLSAEEAAATLEATKRVLRPGGWMILRQLNSSLDMEGIGIGFSWKQEMGTAMERRDRSFFYPRIHVATRL